MLTQFVAAFDDTIIKRYDNDRNPRETIEVRYVMAPKQRVMYDIVDKAQNLTLPVVAVNVTGVSRANNRVFNKLDNIYNPVNETSGSAIKMPIPVDITVSMSILTRYMQDMDQILSNFIPYSDPYVIISWKEPTGVSNQTIEIRTEVLWNGTINFNSPTDLNSNQKIRIVADTSFTIKGWLFKTPNEISTPIYFIDVNTTILNKPTILNYDYLSDQDYTTDTYRISGTPVITNLIYTTPGASVQMYSSPTINKQLSSNNTYVLYGENFDRTTNVLLSTNNPQITNSLTLTSVYSKYTGYATGFIIPPNYYDIVTDGVLTVRTPWLSGSGNFDLIVINPVGWTSTYNISSFSFVVP